jgi:hypothetical protein
MNTRCHRLLLLLLLLSPAPARAQDGAVPQETPREQILRHLESIEWALRAIKTSPGDAELVERAERAILEATAAIRRITEPAASAAPAVEASTAPTPGSSQITPAPTGPWIDPALTGARGPFEISLVSDWGWDPLAEKWFELKSADLRGKQRGVGIIHTHYEGTRGQPLFWNDVSVRGEPDEHGSVLTRWGFIVFDVENWALSNCTMRDIPDEHGMYATTLGGARWVRCLFANIGSQGLQLVGAVPGTPRAPQTAHQNDWLEYTLERQWEWHEISECAFLEVGQPSGGRPSFAISAFEGTRNPVRVERCFLRTRDSRRTDGSGALRDCFGAVMAHDRNRFELLDTYIEYLEGDRDVVQVWYCSDGVEGTPDVVIRGSRVLAARWVDLRVNPTDTVLIEGNAGSTARVRISSNPRDVQANEAAWDPKLVIYEGDLAVDYRFN